MLIELQKEYLEYSNVEILTASDGLEALAAIKAKRPSLIFMDLEMPRMDGAECCRSIKSDPELAGIPVVMVTSRGREADIDLCYSSGCDLYMPKPLDRDTFLFVARKYIPDIERRETRVPVDFPAVLRLKNENVTCRLHDLSLGGAFIITDYFGSLNGVVQISFTLPDGAVLECHGRFTWINRTNSKYPHGIGIKFALLTKEMQVQLKKYIDSRK
jgi:CheY-like chemotaxis protein